MNQVELNSLNKLIIPDAVTHRGCFVFGGNRPALW